MSKRKLIIVIASLIALFFLGYKFLLKEKKEEIKFFQGKGSCSLAVEQPEINLKDKEIIFRGKIGTGNPCYNLSATFDSRQSLSDPEVRILIIDIDSSPSEKICIQCAGSVEYFGKITNLSDAFKYKVLIRSGNTILGEKEF
jgi:hypothetical protein